MEALSRAGSLQFSPKLLLNDFEREASHFVPEVGTALRCAREFFPNTSSLTGSGSAIFSLVDPSETSRLEPFCKAAALEGMVVHRVRLLGEAKD
jgi:4-diphosphocytidyl-2C-methyl-D-erythritol kinase